jgi:hypothetical protein
MVYVMNRSMAGIRGTAVILLMAMVMAGCTGPQQTQKEERDFFSEFPLVALSADVIHSPQGDMTARLPQGWVMLDAGALETPGVFAAACDTAYTLSVVFSEVPVDAAVRDGYSRRGLRGLGEASFQRRQKRSNSRAQLVGDVEEFAIGRRLFTAYTYSTDSMRTLTRTAVFFTQSHLYECAITHLTFSDRALPTPRAMGEIHELVLGTIEW